MYGGKNRTPYVKDAFHDHIVPSHRPKEPESEKGQEEGLPIKKTPTSSPLAFKEGSLPKHTISEEEAASNGHGVEPEDGQYSDTASINTVEPPPRPTAKSGGRQFVNPDKTGTKAGAHYEFKGVPGKGGCVVVRLKMTAATPEEDPAILDEELFDDNIEERRVDADEFYGCIARNSVSDDLQNIMRQALSGMLWTKQYYQYIQKEWIEGDPGQPPPPPERKWNRNKVSWLIRTGA